MNTIGYARIVPGEFVTFDGDNVTGSLRMTGRIRGDYSTGFWAYRLDGTRILREFSTPDDAAEVLALEFALHYGDALAGAA